MVAKLITSIKHFFTEYYYSTVPELWFYITVEKRSYTGNQENFLTLSKFRHENTYEIIKCTYIHEQCYYQFYSLNCKLITQS